MSHPRRIEIERLHAEELAGAEAAALRAHLAGCAGCAGYLRELALHEEARRLAMPADRFLAALRARAEAAPADPPELGLDLMEEPEELVGAPAAKLVGLPAAEVVRLPVAKLVGPPAGGSEAGPASTAPRARPAPAGARRRWIGLGAGLLAAAAALVLLRPAPRPEGVRWRGGDLTVHRLRGGVVTVLGDEGVRAGDGLRVVVTLPRPAPVDAWFVDARGRVDRLWPGGPRPLPAGPQALPDSVTVEAPCVDLFLVVVSGAAARPETEAALRRAVSGGVPAGDAWLPAGAALRRLRCAP